MLDFQGIVGLVVGVPIGVAGGATVATLLGAPWFTLPVAGLVGGCVGGFIGAYVDIRLQ